MMVLTNDTCEYGYSAVLEQIIDGESRTVAYFPKNYTATQKKYSTSEKELLAVVMSIEYFQQYLYGKLERWLLRLALYQFNILYEPRKDNVVADMLSRLPDVNGDESEDRNGYKLNQTSNKIKDRFNRPLLKDEIKECIKNFYALPDTKATAVAHNFVDEWSCTFGVPEAVLSDGGKEFQSKLRDLVYEI
ncbi:unnamed protein product [Brachionus calyciflorus]|uniref:Reverse transcriptase/retrotransposon-derived protein RNase H-like domain-containing protein n=1 Tax=Brachionus calyciflorus TaxID=104777 RepID=A0A814L3L0_9BILA|nr:unnamed protein product [Brachionus calyciflorus]